MAPRLSVVIPTFDPRPAILQRTLDGLRAQTLPPGEWELLLVDNRSPQPLSARVDLGWHPHGRHLREEKPGLTPARLCGHAHATGSIMVMVDDDNVLAPDYLARAANLFAERPHLGAVGGKSLPEYEAAPGDWFADCGVDLACRDLGNSAVYTSWSNVDRHYPACAPIGAGMCIRREAFGVYAAQVAGDVNRLRLDRTGASLASGGDNDIVMTLLDSGWEVGYDPGLVLTHIIPKGRVAADYLGRLSRDSTRTWVQVLALHGITPWSPVPGWMVPLLKAKYWLTMQPWRGPAERIRWLGACGQAEGRALLAGITRRSEAPPATHSREAGTA